MHFNLHVDGCGTSKPIKKTEIKIRRRDAHKLNKTLKLNYL